MLFVAVAVPLALGLIFSSSWIQIVASSSVAVVVLFFAKAKIEGYFLSLLSVTTFVIVAWDERLFGEVIIQLGIATPIMLVGFVAWLRSIKSNKEKGEAAEISICKTPVKELFIMFAVLAAASVGIYFLLRAFETEILIVSTLSVVVSLGASYLLLVRKSYYGMFGFVLTDIVQITLWSLLLASTGDLALVPMVAMSAILLVLDSYGILNWRKKYKLQQI